MHKAGFEKKQTEQIYEATKKGGWKEDEAKESSRREKKDKRTTVTKTGKETAQ